LVNDIGEMLGSFAVLTDLRRVRSGAFSITDAVPIAELRKMEHNQLKKMIKQVPVSVTVG